MKKKVHFYWNTSVSLVSKDQTPNGAAQTGLAVEADAVGPIFLGPTVRQPTVWSKSCRKPPAATWTDTYVTIREREREREEDEQTEAIAAQLFTSEKMAEKRSEGNSTLGWIDGTDRHGWLTEHADSVIITCFIASHVNGEWNLGLNGMLQIQK